MTQVSASSKDMDMMEKKVAETISPTISNVEVLSTLKLLADLDGKEWKDKTKQQLYENETKYLNAAISALTENEQLQRSFGNTLSGAVALSGYLKKMDEEAVVKNLVSSYLPKASAGKGQENDG